MPSIAWIGVLAEETLEQLPAPSQLGKTKMGGIDFNKARMRWDPQAVLALAPSPSGFTATELAHQVQLQSRHSEFQYGTRRAAYDLKNLRGKQFIRRIPHTQRYEPIPQGLKAMAALVLLRETVIKPWLAASRNPRRTRRPKNSTVLDQHYESLRIGLRDLFHDLGFAA